MLKKLKFGLGIALFVLSWCVPLLGILVANTSLAPAAKAAIIGLLTVGGPEILAILGIALLGKEAFEAISSRALSLLSRLAPSGSVSKVRYQIGLVLFLLPIVPTYVMGYAPQFLPDNSPQRLYVNISSDLMFLTSLFVLGGDFWDKLRALFIYDARAAFDTHS